MNINNLCNSGEEIVETERLIMRRITNDDEYNTIWDRLFSEFCFKPLYDDWRDHPWIKVPQPSKAYKIASSYWDEKTEMMVNSLFEKVSDRAVYALNYQHDCFEYNPSEHIPFQYSYEEGGFNIYFPTYYPNGDYHFFIDKDWTYGMFGHPWKQEIVVWGKELIEQFDKLNNNPDVFDLVHYEEWDKEGFSVPEEFILSDKSYLHEAIKVFYAAGGYDFFKVKNPKKYASNWLDFIGNLYARIEAGKYKSDGQSHESPLSDMEKESLRKQGVPGIFID